MGKKNKSEYNDFLDGEKLRDNTEIRTSLHAGGRPANDQAERRNVSRGPKHKGGSKKPQLTHFLCIPLVNDHSRPQLETGLSTLKQELEESGFLPIKAVRPPGTLHLTLGVMSLDAQQLALATRYLEELDVRKILQNVTAQCLAEQAAENGTVSENLNAFAMPDWEALSIDLRGLVPMQAPHKTSILYAEPTGNNQRLQLFGEKLKREFTEQGFLIQDKRTLRLHATVINTIYAKSKGRGGRVDARPPKDSTANEAVGIDGPGGHGDGVSTAGSSIDGDDDAPTAPPDPSTSETKIPKLDGSTGHGPEAKSWLRFDARDLIERYKDFVWAQDVQIDRVQICKMGAKKSFNDEGEIVAEEYEVVGEKVVRT